MPFLPTWSDDADCPHALLKEQKREITEQLNAGADLDHGDLQVSSSQALPFLCYHV
jgi:hypothetical protein